MSAIIAFVKEARHVVDWPQVIPQMAISLVILLVWFEGCKAFFRWRDGQPPSQKKTAWFCSFFVSCMSTPFGILYGREILINPTWTGAIMLEADATSRILLVFFSTYLLFDMFLGLVEYGSEFGVLSGWIHHIFYSGFLAHAYVKGYTVSFGYTLLMESSSILLSGGRLFKPLRQDLLFGILFFIFRIIYHGYLLWELYIIPNPRVIMWPPVFGVWILHWYWLYGWIQSQRRRRKRRASSWSADPLSVKGGKKAL